MKRSLSIMALVLVVSALMSACVPGGFPPPVAPATPAAAQATPAANMPNPASVNCEKQGGTLEIRKDANGGEVGYCKFGDGSECEEWALMRGECAPGAAAPAAATPAAVENMPNPASVNCEKQGGTLEIRKDANGGEVGYCKFGDGSECEEWALMRGECAPGAAAPVANMPNPASVNCEKQGGTLEIRKDANGGEVGYCKFGDGSECEEWALFHGECAPGTAAQATPAANMANPASVNCLKLGGKLDIRKDANGGEVGYCVFAGGTECEEWALMRGECKAGVGINMSNPASVNCQKQGGQLEIRKDANGGETGYCKFADGSECEEWALMRGECAPGTKAP